MKNDHIFNRIFDLHPNYKEQVDNLLINQQFFMSSVILFIKENPYKYNNYVLHKAYKFNLLRIIRWVARPAAPSVYFPLRRSTILPPGCPPVPPFPSIDLSPPTAARTISIISKASRRVAVRVIAFIFDEKLFPSHVESTEDLKRKTVRKAQQILYSILYNQQSPSNKKGLLYDH